MRNLVDSEEYQKYRQDIEKYFKPENVTKTKMYKYDGYSIIIENYFTKEKSWEFTRGTIYKGTKLIADIKRNYSSFPFDFIKHENGNVYIACGEDYQGYTIVNCTQETVQTYIPPAWIHGWAFCWSEINNGHALYYLPEDVEEDERDNDTITVEGCCWGADFEKVVYDFKNPDVLPLPEISRYNLNDDYENESDDDDDE